MKLIIGNKNYSSWSLRGWLAAKQSGLSFEELTVHIDGDDWQATKHSQDEFQPSAGKVPVLWDGDAVIWDSLAIMEYLAEKYPNKNIWPRTSAARAHARVLASEMHAGFMAMRQELPTNFRRAPKKLVLSDDVIANVRRIEDAWADARRRFGKGGPDIFDVNVRDP